MRGIYNNSNGSINKHVGPKMKGDFNTTKNKKTYATKMNVRRAAHDTKKKLFIKHGHEVANKQGN